MMRNNKEKSTTQTVSEEYIRNGGSDITFFPSKLPDTENKTAKRNNVMISKPINKDHEDYLKHGGSDMANYYNSNC